MKIKRKMLSNAQVSAIATELSMLLHSGISVTDGLSLIAHENQGAEQEMFASMSKMADDGEGLSAIFQSTDRFPAYVCGLVEVGEKAGKLEEALSALANYYESRARMDRRVKSALLYPSVMLILMLMVIGVLLVEVLPIFDNVYASLGASLTGVAGGLLTLGRWLGEAMPVLWAMMILVVCFMALFAVMPTFRAKVMAMYRKYWGDKGVARKMNNARLAQALAMAMASGLLVEDALDLAKSLLADVPGTSSRCTDCMDRIVNGSTIGAAMRDSGILDAGDSRLLEMAQRSGSADNAMSKIADRLSEEGESALENAVSSIEPTLVLVCSFLVGAILLSVMLPLTRIMTIIG